MSGSELPLTLGRYELLLRIGSGGMAAVYLARSRGLGGFERDVAVKVTHPHLVEESDFVSGLLQEARIAARIRHPNVVPVLDVGEHGTQVFLVMDYVEGEVLSALARLERNEESRVPPRVAVRILADALAGLHAAHELRDDRGEPLGVIHRDFSPQNILVGVDGAARLTDFGIARVASLSSSTKSGLIKGKLGYLAPEQVRNPRDIDRRADVWAAGIVAWELLAGRLLYNRDEEAATLLRIVSEEPPHVRSVRPDVPEALDEVIAGALRMDVSQRVPTADALRQRLLDAAGPVADAAEVSAYVRARAGEKLRARRIQLEAALARRAVPTETPVEKEPETRITTELSARTFETPVVRRKRTFALGAAVLAAGIAVGATWMSRRQPWPAAALDTQPPSAPSASPSATDPAPVDSPFVIATPPAIEAGASGPVVRTSPRRRPAGPPPTRAPVPSSAPTSARPALPSDPLDDPH
jgi:serine/threonine protein kinase